jgi:2-dehydro-3-deoxygluconokinase
MPANLRIKPSEVCRWDIVSLGEVLLRFDPGDKRLTQTRQFEVWEGGGEYNVARGLSRCFGHRASVVTSLVDNPVGRLMESLMLGGHVDVSHVLWREDDGVGLETRNGTYFLERGFGVRAALGCMDRGHTATSQLRPGEIDWDHLFGQQNVRWFHTGGIFSALSESTEAVTLEAMQSARRHGTIVSFDCNYRPSLWKRRGGRAASAALNCRLAPQIDVLFGHAGDLGLEAAEASADGPPSYDEAGFTSMAAHLAEAYPNVRLIACPVRKALSANRNDWRAYASDRETIFAADPFPSLEILDRVGGGDAFAAGFIHGLLRGETVAWSLQCGTAHGALAMTSPGDGSYATPAEVERLMRGSRADVDR